MVGDRAQTISLDRIVNDAKQYEGSHLRAAIEKFKESGFYHPDEDGHKLLVADDFVAWPGLDDVEVSGVESGL